MPSASVTRASLNCRMGSLLRLGGAAAERLSLEPLGSPRAPPPPGVPPPAPARGLWHAAPTACALREGGSPGAAVHPAVFFKTPGEHKAEVVHHQGRAWPSSRSGQSLPV